MEELELKCFEIITNVGSARSYCIEAIAYAKDADFEQATQSLKDADEAFKLGHYAHADLIQKEASGESVPISLILLHAEDQLMSAEGFKIVAKEFVELYQRIESMEKK